MLFLAFDLDVHRIGKPVAGMVAGRNLEHSAAGVDIAAKNPEAWTAPADLQLLADGCGSGNGLNVLNDARHSYASMLLELLEERLVGLFDLLCRFRQVGVNINVRNGYRQALPCRSPNPGEVKPWFRRGKPNLFCVFLRESNQSSRFEDKASVRRVLKDLFHVREWLVQCASTGSCRLNQRSGSTAPFYQSFRLKHSQCFSHGESTDTVPFAKNGFGRKLAVSGEFAAEYFFPKDLGELKVPGLLVGNSRSLGQQLNKLSLVAK